MKVGTQSECHMNVKMTLHLSAKEKAMAWTFQPQGNYRALIETSRFQNRNTIQLSYL